VNWEAMTTWRIEDNNRALNATYMWYNDRDEFHRLFWTSRRCHWSITYEASSVIGDFTFPIECLHDGPFRHACGAVFGHMIRRDWHLSFHVYGYKSGLGPFHEFAIVQMREVFGLFGWKWLAGRMRLEMNGKDYLVLFCNETWLDGGHNFYVSRVPYNEI
jgi:hypothetical protein